MIRLVFAAISFAPKMSLMIAADQRRLARLGDVCFGDAADGDDRDMAPPRGFLAQHVGPRAL